MVFKEGDTADAQLLERCASIDLTGGGTVRVFTVPGSLSNEFEVLVPGAKAKVLRVPGAPAKTSRDVPKTHAHKCTLASQWHESYDRDGAVCGVCFLCAMCGIACALLSLSARHRLVAQRGRRVICVAALGSQRLRWPSGEACSVCRSKRLGVYRLARNVNKSVKGPPASRRS